MKNSDTEKVLPPDPSVSGWHWLELSTRKAPLFWFPEWQVWIQGAYRTGPGAAASYGWKYLAPVASPERVAALEAVAKAAIGEALTAKLGGAAG